MSRTPPPNAFVSAAHRGQARAFRSRVAADFTDYVDASLDLIEPFSGVNNSKFWSKTLLKHLPAEWRALPAFGRLRLRIGSNPSKSGSNPSKSGRILLRIVELRATPSAINLAKWGDDAEEVGVALAYRVVEIARPFRDELTVFAIIGLHALARRIERGLDRSDAGILRDLALISHPKRRGGPEFEVPVPGGGKWRGTAMNFADGRPSLVVRTFLNA